MFLIGMITGFAIYYYDEKDKEDKED